MEGEVEDRVEEGELKRKRQRKKGEEEEVEKWSGGERKRIACSSYLLWHFGHWLLILLTDFFFCLHDAMANKIIGHKKCLMPSICDYFRVFV